MESSRTTPNPMRLGIWNVLNDPFLVPDSFKDLDFVFLDLEHGFRDFSACQATYSKLIANGIDVFVRIRNSEDVLVQSLLDLGVRNFIVPQVRTLTELHNLSRRVSFPPKGSRGFHPRISRNPDSLKDNFRDIQLFPIIETREILNFLPEIFALDNVAGVYFGNFDLSFELECQKDFSDPVMNSALEKSIIEASKAAKRFVAMPKDDSEMTLLSLKGVSEFVIGIDSEMLYESIRLVAGSFKEKFNGS